MSHPYGTSCVKTWRLSTGEIDKNDVAFLVGLGIRVHVDRPTHKFETLNGRTHTIAGTAKIQFITTTEKQDTMLLLKYGNDIVLVSKETLYDHISSF